MPNTHASIESLPTSLSRITSIPTGCVSVLPEDDIFDDDPAVTQVHQGAHDPDDEDEDNDKDNSTLQEGEHNRRSDDILSKITEGNQKEMLEQNWILLKLLFVQQAEWKEERARMLTEFARSRITDRPENPRNQSKFFKMVDSLRYCCGAKALDMFLETFRSNFPSHKHLFPRRYPDQVKYAVCFLDTWNNTRDTTQRQTEHTDPSEWASDLRAAKHLCLEHLNSSRMRFKR
jgi:hypothetical protein